MRKVCFPRIDCKLIQDILTDHWTQASNPRYFDWSLNTSISGKQSRHKVSSITLIIRPLKTSCWKTVNSTQFFLNPHFPGNIAIAFLIRVAQMWIVCIYSACWCKLYSQMFLNHSATKTCWLGVLIQSKICKNVMYGYIFTILEPTDTNLVFVKKNCYPHLYLMELVLGS